MNPELTLAKAVDQARLDEAVKKQQSVVRGSTSQTSNQEPKVEFVQKKFKKKKNPASKAMDRKKTVETKCNRCGKAPAHPRQECPAKSSTCHKCKKKGHFKSVCKSVSEVNENSEDEEFFMGSVHLEELQSDDNYWNINLKFQGVSVNCKIDTDADVTVVPE